MPKLKKEFIDELIHNSLHNNSYSKHLLGEEINLVNNNYKAAEGVTLDMSSPEPKKNSNVDVSLTGDSPSPGEEINKNNISIRERDPKEEWKIKLIWKTKCMRFLSYCLNGGLTDFMLTYEKFISEFVMKVQSTNNDIVELIFQTINIMDLKNILGNEIFSSKDMISSANEGSELIFNEDALAVCIKTGFLSKNIFDSPSSFSKFLKFILQFYCTNKILSKINNI
jgi:hypothetical protein